MKSVSEATESGAALTCIIPEVVLMSFTILGTGKAVPEYVMDNDELSTMVETNDEWIRTMRGLRLRSWILSSAPQ